MINKLNYRSDKEYGDFPLKKEIERDYYEFISVVKNITTINDVQELDKSENHLTIEVNGDYVDDFISAGGTDENIKYIRYYSYGCLNDIYVSIKHGKFDDITFDVWSNGCQNTFIENTSIDNVKNNYTIMVNYASQKL